MSSVKSGYLFLNSLDVNDFGGEKESSLLSGYDKMADLHCLVFKGSSKQTVVLS
jgi:hypothetical protein